MNPNTPDAQEPSNTPNNQPVGDMPTGQPTSPAVTPQTFQPSQPAQPTGTPTTFSPTTPPAEAQPTAAAASAPQQQPAYQQPDSFQSDPTAASSPSPTPPGNGKKRLLMILAVVIIVLGLAAAAFTVLNNSEENNNANKAADESSEQSDAVALDSLQSATLLPPVDLSGYNADSVAAEEGMSYSTKDGTCALELGTTTASALPGADIGEIVDKQLQSLRDQGITISSPTAGTPLEIADADDADVTYTMPTLVFTANNDGGYVRSHYSAAVLKDNSRVYVTRVCTAQGADVPESTIAPLDADAATITVKKP